jgi:glycosyltransferase involved in cell wall biosynthesis
VPSYNKPEFLPECLRSIQAQTFEDWECIVVSDGAPRVEEIRAAVEGMQDPRFRLVEHKENRGPAAARNTGGRHARADLWIWVDEDDVLERNCLGRLVALQCEYGAEIVRPGIGRLGSGSRLGDIQVPNRIHVLVRPGLYSVGFLLHRSVFTRVGELDEAEVLLNGLEDVEWWIRVIWADVKIVTTEEVLYLYRAAENTAEREMSQHNRGMRNAAKIGKYIVHKHIDKYRQFPLQRRHFLARCYGMQLAAAVHDGDVRSALRNSVIRFFYQPTWKNLRTMLGLGRLRLRDLAGEAVQAARMVKK